MAVRIPSDLLSMLQTGRVIPFIGAGFSASLGLPGWDSLLRTIAAEVQDAPPYDEITRCCQGDHLQIAEYFFLKYDKSIGPIRHQLSTLLRPKKDPINSTAHVELINLNAQQIYTTNYDESIEQAFRSLGAMYSLVALPKDIALADRSKPQVVKYHGDLRYDKTLVLTESSYYSRLEFESPMDLKFRSDLLGRSVLFIGYSFRDINIRIIWFKLMEMMKDVPGQDIPSSFIVRFERNDVLEELYDAVGIRTIYLDPDGKAPTPDERAALLDEFMLDLSLSVSSSGTMPNGDRPMYVSDGLLKRVESFAFHRPRGLFSSRAALSPIHAAAFHHLNRRLVLPQFRPRLDELLAKTSMKGTAPLLVPAAVQLFKTDSTFAGARRFLLLSLVREASRDELLVMPDFPWAKLWEPVMTEEFGMELVKRLINETDSGFGPDHDVAFAADLVSRLLRGMVVQEPSSELLGHAKDALERASLQFSEVANLSPQPDGPPAVSAVLAQVDAASPSHLEDEPTYLN